MPENSQPTTTRRTPASRIGWLVLWLLVWASLTVLIASVGILVFYGRITPDQLILNLVAVRTDAGGGALFATLAVIGIVVVPIAATLLLALARGRRLKKHRTAGTAPKARTAKRVLGLVLTVVLMASAAGSFVHTLKIRDYVASGDNSADIGNYYTVPEVTGTSQKRNLVVIYLESGEATLGDDTVFEKDMLAPAKDATSDWIGIEDYQQYTGGGWTMAGIVSTQCGVPLKGKISAPNSEIVHELSSGMDSYLPGLTCLGDVLADQGYKNVFMGGSNASFAAKNQFLADHGYSEEYDLTTWQKEDKDPSHFRKDWGLSDQQLMAHAKKQVDQLHANAEKTGQPFNLSMLTLDTHEPTHVYDYCDVNTEEPMASVYSCSMEQVADFVGYMKSKGYLKDTSVVMMGDHLKQLGAIGAFSKELKASGHRTIFNRVWIPGQAPVLREGADQLSMYATLLQAAGLEFKGSEAGLGVSAFTSDFPAGSALSLTPEKYKQLLESRSDEFYQQAWGQ